MCHFLYQMYLYGIHMFYVYIRGQQLEPAGCQWKSAMRQTWSCIGSSWNRYLHSWWNGWH